MRHLDLMRSVLASCAAAALLAGCAIRPTQDDTPPLIAAPGAVYRESASYRQLYRFHPPTDGTHPLAGLTDVGGTLYGTTEHGGLSDKGTVYSISTSGLQKVLHRFRGGADGAYPQSGLLDVNGTLYGTTAGGGPSYCGNSFPINCGTVFSITPAGREKVLYAFQGGSDGARPASGLIDVNGTLYGTTLQGGGHKCNGDGPGCGTVFSVTTSGQERVLHAFRGGSDGANPAAGLIAVKGVLYGTTIDGGDGGHGTVYSVTPAGVEKVRHAFQRVSAGHHPASGLTDVNGMLYGTTNEGGNLSGCSGGCGVVYGISPQGAEKTLYAFIGGSDGAAPQADLIAVNGVLYGTTMGGGGTGSCFTGPRSCGTVYSITTGGVETVLYRFAGGTDGDLPAAALTNVNGTLYGTTVHGGKHDVCCVAYGYGTVFALSPKR
jgi:uncharacterized repeat protein (TIGR03803 family)